MSKKEKIYQYDPKRRKLAKVYSKEKFLMYIINDLIIALTTISIFYFYGYSEKLANWSLSNGFIPGIILYVLLFTTLMFVVSFPLRLYSGLFYEKKYGLSNQKFGAWMVDYLKSSFIGYLILVPVGSVTAYLILTTKMWWIYVVIFNIIVTSFIDLIYPVVILPFLYKLEPYKNKMELRTILNIVKNAGVPNLKHIKVQKESEKSNKVNAFFAGLGKTKTIVLYDNLIKSFTKKEVRTVIGHELGHYVHKDIIKFTILEAIETLITFFLINKILTGMFGNAIPLSALPIVSLISAVFGLLILPISMSFSRRQERAADWFALDYVKEPYAQISTERRLADHDLGDENPNPIIEFWFHSHPSAEKRIRMVEKWMKTNKS